EDGVYTLLLSMNNDQNIQSVTWGVKTNAQLFIINSCAGHTDRRRLEPIILNGGNEPFGIYFKPEAGNFEVSVSNLPEDVETLQLFDGSETLIKELLVKGNQVNYTVFSRSSDVVWVIMVSHPSGTTNSEGIIYRGQ